MGRRDSLRALRTSVLSQTDGSVALVGPAGIGKTHLATDLATEAEQRGFVVLRAVGGETTARFPFAALAPLLPPLGDQRDATALFQQVTAAWKAEHGTTPLVLFIDDCHLLDPGSAALVQQLRSAGVCRLLATIRSDNPLPDAIDALWRSGDLEIIDVDPLTPEDLHRLLEQILGPPVSMTTTERLFRRTEGNPLYVREMVRAALVDESLTKDSGIWELHRTDTRSSRLSDVVRRRIGSLEKSAMEALELLAVAEVLSESDLNTVLPDPPLEDLEDRGLIILARDGHRSQVRLSHPVFAEILRADMPRTRERRLKSQLAAHIEGCGARRRDDVLHLVTWLRDTDQVASAEQLVAASKRAQALFDLPLAIDLAQQAMAAGGGTQAAVALAEADFRNGDVTSALKVLAQAADAATSDDEVAGIADTRAHVLCLAGRSAEAFEVLEAARQKVSPESAEQIAGRTAVLMIQNAGRPREALAAVDQLRHGGQATMSTRSRMRADYVAGLALPLIGRSADALRVCREFADWLRRETDIPIPEEQALIGSTLAHLLAGELAAAGSDADALQTGMVRLGDLEGEATGALLRGRVAIASGDVLRARRLFERALAINEGLDDQIGIRWSLGAVALAAGLTGDAEAASEAAERIRLDTVEPAGLFEPDLVQRGLAWAAVACGQPVRAKEILTEAATTARALGQIVSGWQLEHDLLRLGAPPSADLLSAGGTRWAVAAGEHARAVAERDPIELERVALRWAELGFVIEAAEALAAAVDLQHKAGQSRRASALLTRFDELRGKCQAARTPGLLRPSEQATSLTRREREIADLAIQNLTAASIAERLVLSRRTVENHLQRVYTKLGVTNRAELEQYLRGT